MAVSKIKMIIMTAVIIVALLAVLFGGLFYPQTLQIFIKDGSIVIPDPITAFPTTPSPTAEIAPEGLAFRCTFKWEEKDEPKTGHESVCYLKIYTSETEGTLAQFGFGEYLIDGWPVYLVKQTGDHYVLESSTRSLVERVRIVVDVTDTKITGTVDNITPKISNFVKGSLTGEPIPYGQYQSEVSALRGY